MAFLLQFVRPTVVRITMVDGEVHLATVVDIREKGQILILELAANTAVNSAGATCNLPVVRTSAFSEKVRGNTMLILKRIVRKMEVFPSPDYPVRQSS